MRFISSHSPKLAGLCLALIFAAALCCFPHSASATTLMFDKPYGTNPSSNGTVVYNADSDTYRYTLAGGVTHWEGIYFQRSCFKVGETYTMRYKFKKVSGKLSSFGGHCPAYSVSSFKIDGVEQSASYHASATLSDNSNEHTVVVTFTAINYTDTTQSPHMYIQPNRGKQDALVCDIYDISLDGFSNCNMDYWYNGFKAGDYPENDYSTGNSAAFKVFVTTYQPAGTISLAMNTRPGHPGIPKGYYLDEANVWTHTASAGERNLTNSSSVTLSDTDHLANAYRLYPTRYSITYNLADTQSSPAQNNVANPSYYTITQGAQFASPSRTGYTFEKWMDGTGATRTSIDYGLERHFTTYRQLEQAMSAREIGALSLTAHWTANEYSISFDKNADGATGTQQGMNAVYDSPPNAPACTFEKTGYTFKYWTTSSNDPGSGYETGDPLPNLASEDGATATLYAQWRPNEYSVTFDSGQQGEFAENMPAAVPASYDSDATMPAAPSAPGYDFVEWNSAADGSGTGYAAGTPVQNLSATDGGTVELYAIWSYSPVATGLADSGFAGTALTLLAALLAICLVGLRFKKNGKRPIHAIWCALRHPKGR